MLKTLLILPVALLGFTLPAAAAGCLSGGAAGGAAGHFVGKGHAVLGAAAGCAVGLHMKHKQQRAAHAKTPAVHGTTQK